MKARSALQFIVLYVLANAAAAQPVSNDGYARDMSSDVVKNPFGLCWRTSAWTEAKAVEGCDATPRPVRAEPAPARVVPQVAEPKVMEAPRPAPTPIVAAPIAPAPAVVPVSVRRQAITLGADASFDTGKAEALLGWKPVVGVRRGLERTFVRSEAATRAARSVIR